MSMQSDNAGVGFLCAPACADVRGESASTLERSVERADGPVTVRAQSLWRTAIHESGHVLCDRFLDFPLAGVTIVPGPGYAGVVWGSNSTRARKGKAAYDSQSEDEKEAVAPRIAALLSRFLPGPGEPRGASYDVYANTQAKCVGLMGGYAAEMTIIGDIVPVSIESDCNAANQLAKVICRSSASRSAFLEYVYQEALALVEAYEPAVLALAHALVDHPDRTLNAAEIDQVIATAVAQQSRAVDRARREEWRALTERVAISRLTADVRC